MGAGGKAENIVVEGRYDSRFTPVAEQFRNNFSPSPSSKLSCTEIGAALSVYVDDREVVNIWAGHLDAERQRPWQQDSEVCVFSCTKGVVSLIAMRLVESSLLDYEAPVVNYWPEYASHGKENTLVKHLLSHQAGLPAHNTGMAAGEIWNWSSVCTSLANSPPQWTPGASHGYHALTWGYLVGAVLERAGGASLEVLLQREVCDVLEVPFSFGLPGKKVANCANLVSSAATQSNAAKADLAQLTKLDSAILLNTSTANSEYWRNAVIPAANGFCSASSLATIYEGILSKKSSYLSEGIIEQATAQQALGKDSVLGLQSAYGMGFQLPTADLTAGSARSHNSIGHKGIYGSTGFFDQEHKLAVGYVMNHCGDPAGDERAQYLLESLYDCL